MYVYLYFSQQAQSYRQEDLHKKRTVNGQNIKFTVSISDFSTKNNNLYLHSTSVFKLATNINNPSYTEDRYILQKQTSCKEGKRAK